MKKLITLAFLTFVLVAGAATVIMVHPQPAFADGGSCSNC